MGVGNVTTTPQPPPDTPAPEAYFDCVGCQGEVTYPAEMLRWWDGKVTLEDEGGQLWNVLRPGWWCEHCDRGGFSLEELKGHVGPTLAEWLAARKASAA